MKDTVLFEVDEAIATITLNRPERLNAINPPLLEALTAALQRANEDPHINVIVLQGAGRAFCAGDGPSYQCDRAAGRRKGFLCRGRSQGV